MLGKRGMCERCAAEHWASCPRDHVPNVVGAFGYCLGQRCIVSRAGIAALPMLCVPKLDGFPAARLEARRRALRQP
jgi:hypothetical protein